MQSSHFGSIWETFFLTATGYHLNPEHRTVKDAKYKLFFELFGDTIPCKHCRTSYKVFFKELPIEDFMSKKWGLVRWTYELKEKVNNKLKKQEQDCLQQEFNDNIKKYPGGTENPKFWEDFRLKVQQIIYTKATPEYEEVLEKYLNLRANCNGKNNHCRTPLMGGKPRRGTKKYSKKSRVRSRRDVVIPNPKRK